MPQRRAEDSAPSLRLFLIDDHPLYRAGLREALEEERDIEVVGESGRGSHALDVVISSAAEVVLLDLRLPDIDGIVVCRTIVSNTRARCIILTSFHASESDLVRAAKAGASAYLVKGASLAELVASIRSVAAGTDLMSGAAQVRGYP